MPKQKKSKQNKKRDYEVGFGKPPKEHQFKPGVSGNVTGRPKGKKNLSTMFAEAVNARVPVIERGSKRSVPMGEALIKNMIAEAFNGSMNDKVKFFHLLKSYQPDAPLPEEYHNTRYIQFIESDGNGRPANPEDLEAIKDLSKYRIVDTPSELSDWDAHEAEKLDPDSIEAAWKAAGIDDDEI